MNERKHSPVTVARLQFITLDGHTESHLRQVRRACQAGIKWVQLRVKEGSREELRHMARAAREVCSRYDARLIINDHLDLALECGADGLHLGQRDMPLTEARKHANNLLIGGTANTPEQALHMARQGADYIGAGPFRFTATKKLLSPILGLRGLEAILERLDREQFRLPVIAVGGIRPEDLKQLLLLPLHGVAISGAIARAPAPSELVKTIAEHFKHHTDVATR